MIWKMWWIVGGLTLALVLVLLVVVPAVVLRAMEPALRRRVAAVSAADQIVLEDYRALSLGLESKGAIQGRGNGALVLTAGELQWFQFVGAADLRIPRDAITEVKTVRSHLGKSLVRELLHVAFVVDGKPDSIAWYVTDLAAWLDRLGASRAASAAR